MSYRASPNVVRSLLIFFSIFLQNRQDVAHSDQPLKEGNIHISAPHIYGSVVEALELHPNSALSVLNAGSGTGYLSCIAAIILGQRSSHYCKTLALSFPQVMP